MRVIYLLHLTANGHWCYKIGTSKVFKNRIRQLSRIFQDIEVVATAKFPAKDYSIEADFHRLFSKKRYDGHYCEELFDLDEQDVALFRQKAIEWRTTPSKERILTNEN